MPLISVESTVGGRDVVASGSLVSHAVDERFILKLADLTFELHLVKLDGEKLSRVEGETQGEKGLKLSLINFDNPLGTEYHSPVGHLLGRELFLAVMVHAVNGGVQPRLLTYTLTLGVAAP